MKSEPRIAGHQAQSRQRFSGPGTCLFGVVIGLIFVLLLSGQTHLINRVPLDKSPQSLAARSRQILRELGYADSPVDVWFGFGFDDSWRRFVENRDTSFTRWDSLKTGEMPVVGFQYRQSPLPLDPLNRLQVTFDDPPQSFSNMTSMILDGQGHLLTFFRVPPQVEEPRTSPFPVPDWSMAFREAGLNLEEFQSTAPHWTPPYYGDAQSAWEGRIPGKNRIPVRIEAAAYRGKLVYFEIVHPNSTSYRQVELAPRSSSIRLGLALMGCLVSLSVVIVFIYRTRWHERSKSKSAFRLGVLVFLVTFLRNVFLNHQLHVAKEFGFIVEDIAASLLPGTLAWLLCVALEPFAQNRWQRLLLSWRRLLSGNLRDPIVGRDTLVGCLLGVSLSVTRCGGLVTPQVFGHPPVFPGAGLASFAHLINPMIGALSAINTALFLGLGLFFVFALCDLIFRKEWTATLVIWATLTTLFVFRSQAFWTDFIFAALSSVVLILCLTRLGPLSEVLLFFVHDLTYRELPITWRLNSWFATGTVLMLVLVLGVALYGFWTWLGGEETTMRKPG